MTNLDKLFRLANDPNACNVIVNLKNGYREYKICDGNGKVILNGDNEEKVFLLFKYPELYLDEAEKFLSSNKVLEDEYFKNPEEVRKLLRNKFKKELYAKANEILGFENVIKRVNNTTNGKPIHKSKTIVTNTSLIIGSIVLLIKGITDKNVNEIEKALAILIPAMINFILRLITKEPIKI